jgi:hypothetical protein
MEVFENFVRNLFRHLTTEIWLFSQKVQNVSGLGPRSNASLIKLEKKAVQVQLSYLLQPALQYVFTIKLDINVHMLSVCRTTVFTVC